MPRNPNHGTSSLRNRNRVTNKTRLRILEGNIEADPFLLEEDEEKARVISTAGVDAEDANEHHLQAVLSAAAARHQAQATRPTRAPTDKDQQQKSTAYIPVPDSQVVEDNYGVLYPEERWHDPQRFVCTINTVEETIDTALANDFTYTMDDRDKEWLDKNNEEARGEGTSAQGALSTTRSGGTPRSARAKGKEPDVPPTAVMTEDELELVMGLFEQVTHEKTEFLHHSLETGMSFPLFSDYQDVFASDLDGSRFAATVCPAWIPPPAKMLRHARAVYPHWRERRIERAGHRIIPNLNYDEQDLSNESYICFRRREVKAVRKTRTQQVASSEKMVRLEGETMVAADAASRLPARELQKRGHLKLAREVSAARLAFVNAKRALPTALCGKDDEDLLFDKERVAKKSKTNEHGRLPPIKLQTPREPGTGSPLIQFEVQIKPKERLAQIEQYVHSLLSRHRERDSHWEDAIDNAYQRPPASSHQRAWKWFAPPDSQGGSEDEATPRPRAAVRLRVGRGGRQHVDRRPHMRIASRPGHAFFHGKAPEDPPSPSVVEPEEIEREWRRRERWLNDGDDYPAVGPEGSDEQDRVLLDDFQAIHTLHSTTLLNDVDLQALTTDASITMTVDGQPKAVLPYKLGPQPPHHRIPMNPQRPPMGPPNMHTAANLAQIPLNASPLNQLRIGSPQKSPAVPLRISSQGNMRPPPPPHLNNVMANASSPPRSANTPAAMSESSPSPTRSNATPIPPADAEDGGAAAASSMPYDNRFRTGFIWPAPAPPSTSTGSL